MRKNVPKDSLAYRLARVRFELGISQKDFANLLDVAQSTVSKIEKGDRLPDYKFLEDIVNCFNVNLMYIFGKSEDIFIIEDKQE